MIFKVVKRKSLGDILVDAGYITQTQLQECVGLSVATNQRLGEVLVEKQYISNNDLYTMLANQHGVSYVDLAKIAVDSNISALVPLDMARRNQLVPVKVENNVLFVAIEDPKNFRALSDVRTVARMEIRPMLANVSAITEHIERVYGGSVAQKAVTDYSKEQALEDIPEQTIVDVDVSGAPIVRLVNSILERAVVLGASDIHCEPLEHELRVRMRVDGVLTTVLTAPANTKNAVIARLKILGSLNIAERRVPQDGRFNISVMNRDVDVRLSIIATVFGEKAVLRLLDRGNFFKSKEALGFTEENLQKFNTLLEAPHGIILITGPTGSGKSTTMYSMLAEMNQVSDNIVTVEDPVEFMMQGLNQMQVNHKAGVDFATGLRAILRQDPDIVMIGEIRDAETVEIAVRAAITGHLVLSTIHTNDAVSSVMRLIDMGIPSYMVEASLVGLISQRLVRTICASCKEEYMPSDEEIDEIGESLIEERVHFYRGRGCPSCHYTGYKGRIAVHEVVIVDRDFRRLVHDGASVEALQDLAISHGMVPIKDAAIDLVRRGISTLSEVSTIIYDT